MPHLSCGPAHDHPTAAVVLPLISPLLTRSAPARPLASETLAAVHEKFPKVLKQVVVRSSIPRSPLDHIRYPDSKPPVRSVSNTQAVTMRFLLAERASDGEVLRAVPAQRSSHKWVFPVSRCIRYHMVVCIELADNASVSVFPMESASHVVAEGSNASTPTGSLSQTLEIQSADAYYAGRGVLLLVPWNPADLLTDDSMQEIRMHLFTKVCSRTCQKMVCFCDTFCATGRQLQRLVVVLTPVVHLQAENWSWYQMFQFLTLQHNVQVVGFSELIKISKRVHMNVTDSNSSVRNNLHSSEPMQVPLDVVQAAREGGIHFEAHIPLSKQVLEGA